MFWCFAMMVLFLFIFALVFMDGVASFLSSPAGRELEAEEPTGARAGSAEAAGQFWRGASSTRSSEASKLTRLPSLGLRTGLHQPPTRELPELRPKTTIPTRYPNAQVSSTLGMQQGRVRFTSQERMSASAFPPAASMGCPAAHAPGAGVSQSGPPHFLAPELWARTHGTQRRARLLLLALIPNVPASMGEPTSCRFRMPSHL
mmetsp:Transcript_132414/g.369141  ORF Transcript_132414/g.369141 Transcript_132414/m.369141 type:complete len:203 (+) Transcript_132414:1-609(+)